MLTQEEINHCFEVRFQYLDGEMLIRDVDIVIFCNNENHRNPAIRYFTNFPSDAVFIYDIAGGGIPYLFVWDINLAEKLDLPIPRENIFSYAQSGSTPTEILNFFLKKTKFKPATKKIEIDPETSYPDFLDFVDNFNDFDIVCQKEGSIHEAVNKMRAIKDDYEIECTMQAANITNEILKILETDIQSGKIKTETDVALTIEVLCRKFGCEKTSFDTLAAGPERSFAIHAFPGYTDKPFATEGLSLVDFGVCYKGYASDVTLTIARGKLTEKQELMLSLVQEASQECLKLYKDGNLVKDASLKADKIFAKAKMKMPHSLGHGTGLEIHEAPFVRAKASNESVFKNGMIVTLEPGLYDSKCGGVRLENDVLICEGGNQVLTKSKILRLE